MQVNRRQFVIASAAAAGCGCLGSCASTAAHHPMADGPVDIGALADYPHDGITDRWAESHGFYVVRENGRLVAVWGDCTHKRCLVEPENEDGHRELVCGCHGSRFTAAGHVVKGPARLPLAHLGISLDASSHVIVDPSKRFDETQWDQPGAFIVV